MGRGGEGRRRWCGKWTLQASSGDTLGKGCGEGGRQGGGVGGGGGFHVSRRGMTVWGEGAKGNEEVVWCGRRLCRGLQGHARRRMTCHCGPAEGRPTAVAFWGNNAPVKTGVGEGEGQAGGRGGGRRGGVRVGEGNACRCLQGEAKRIQWGTAK